MSRTNGRAIRDMLPGTSGWAVSWAIDEGPDGFLTIRGNHACSPTPGGTAILRVYYLSPGTRLVELTPSDCSFGDGYAQQQSDRHKIPLDTEVVVPVV